MGADSIRGLIAHESAALRAQHPRVAECRAALEEWQEGGAPRYALHCDIRWPQHQRIFSGPAEASPEAAVEAGFRAVRTLLAA